MRTWWIWLGLVACGGGHHEPLPPPCEGVDCGCPTGQAVCGGACIDVTGDAANCGGCGHDCGGSSCLAGACLAQRLASVPNKPAALAIDGGDLVFATGGASSSSGSVYRLPVSGGDPTLVYHGLGLEPSLAVSADGIVVSDTGQGGQPCTVDAGGGGIIAIASGQTTLVSRGRKCAHGLVPHDGGLTWIEEDASQILFPVDLGPWIATLPGQASPDQAPTLIYGRQEAGIDQLVAAGTTLLWRDGLDTLMQMPLAGGPASSIATTASAQGLQFVLDGDRVAYTNGHLVIRSLTTGAETSVDFTPSVGELLALDPTFVYWSDGQAIWVGDPSMHATRPLADIAPSFAVQDDQYLYFLVATSRGTDVVRLRKPASATPFDPPQQCPTPLERCSSDPAAPCIALTSVAHCGSCTNACGVGEECVAGACACGPLALTCGGACVDPSTDANNCGACGHSCEGGTCSGGDCTPAMIEGPVNDLVADASAVFYVDGAAVVRLDEVTHVATTLASIADSRTLAADATTLYVVENGSMVGNIQPGTIHAVSKDGQMAPSLYTNRPDPRQPAIAGSTVAWVEAASSTTELPAKLVYAAADGTGIRGSLQPVGLYPGSNDDESRGLVVVGTSAYWLLGDFTAMHGAIVQIDLSKTPATMTVVTELDGDPTSIAFVGGRLYVTTRGGNAALLSVAVGGGPIEVDATGLANPTALVATPEGSLLWIEGNEAPLFQPIVRELAPGYLVPRVVASALHDPNLLRVDANHLYINDLDLYAVTR